MSGEQQTCPRCGRRIGGDGSRWNKHRVAGRTSPVCPMSGLRLPISGDSPADWEARAELVGSLAWRIRDEDPHRVWEHLTTMPGAELQRLLIVALASVPVDVPMRVSLGWVSELPAARWSA